MFSKTDLLDILKLVHIVVFSLEFRSILLNVVLVIYTRLFFSLNFTHCDCFNRMTAAFGSYVTRVWIECECRECCKAELQD